MSFYDVMRQYAEFDFETYFNQVTDQDVLNSLAREKLTQRDYLNLLAPKAETHLEAMAQKAHHLTVQYFGKTIQLYIPLYIANYCVNQCLYCGFNRTNRIARKKLSLAEIESEARAIAKTQMKHILVLTGEARETTPLDYLEAAVTILKKYFASIAIEIFPLQTGEYARLKAAGVDALTIYQEVYDPDVYQQVHRAGPKTDYRRRLETPERGARAGLRMVNIGTLFGLGPIRSEAFFSGLHARYLADHYLDTEISLSLPRMNEAEGGFKTLHPLGDKRFVQIMLAYRLFLPRAGITISTRETAAMRDRLLYLGTTRFSAGSKTEVGGYTAAPDQSTPQFAICDTRSVAQITAAIRTGGYQPVYKDWELI